MPFPEKNLKNIENNDEIPKKTHHFYPKIPKIFISLFFRIIVSNIFMFIVSIFVQKIENFSEKWKVWSN